MNEGKELIKALDDIEKEKGISKDILLEAIENSLVAACKNEYGKADNIRVTMNRETGEVKVFADKTVVEEVEDPEMEISVADARLKNKFYDPGDIVHVEIVPKNFGRIAAQIQADRPYQALYCRSKEYNKGTEGHCITYTS